MLAARGALYVIIKSVGFFRDPQDMGPLYGKFPIIFPYPLHKNP